MPINSGDTTWILVSAALVMIMTPGVGFFYGGMVRQKNVLSVLTHTFIILMLISVQWVLLGYSLAFGSDHAGFIGGLDWVGLQGVGLEPYAEYSSTIPHQAFVIFQAMFAIITPALIVGAFAERVKVSAFVVFSLLWATVVYDPVAHWVWGVGGWLGQLNALDFAGGTVVHITAGAAALASTYVIRPRRGFGVMAMESHNIPYVLLGAALLWFGWFGFNGGSALAAGGLATNAVVTTHTAAATAGITWMLISWCHKGKPGSLGVTAGAVAGLVAITPAAGFVSPLSSIAIGFGAGVLCYMAALLRVRMKLDDSLDVWAIHGVGGTWGAIATGIFADAAIGGVNGLLYGNSIQVLLQIVGVASVWVYSFIVTLILFKILDKVMGLQVKPEEEEVGLDISQHGERAYANS